MNLCLNSMTDSLFIKKIILLLKYIPDKNMSVNLPSKLQIICITFTFFMHDADAYHTNVSIICLDTNTTMVCHFNFKHIIIE